MRALRLYTRYIGISIRTQLQYKVSFFMQTIGHLLVTAIEFLGMWALFDRFGSLREWRLEEVALFYGFIQVTFSFSDAWTRGFDVIAGTIKNGDFDRVLLRPRSTVLQLMGQELVLRRIGRLTQGLAVLCWSITVLDLSWTLLDVAVLLFAFAGGIALFSGIIVIQATLAFWTVETLEIMNTITYGGVETAQYPLAVYRSWFQKFFTFVVPLACVTYYPLCFVLGKETVFLSASFGTVSPIFGFIFAGLGLVLWRFGIRRYTSTGS